MQNQHTITVEILKSMSGAVGKVLGVSHPSDVADCVNDACVRILSNVASFDDAKGSFKGWCGVIASNTAKNWRKAAANNGHDSEGHADDDGETSVLVDTLIGSDGRVDAESRSNGRMLAAAIASLESDERDFTEALFDGMGQTEAGAILGWSAATASRKRREIADKLAAAMA